MVNLVTASSSSSVIGITVVTLLVTCPWLSFEGSLVTKSVDTGLTLRADGSWSRAPDLMSGGVGFAGFLSGLAGPVLMMVCWLHVILGDPYTAMSSIVLSGWKMLLGLLSRVRKSLCSE